jgi:hypothetical protein
MDVVREPVKEKRDLAVAWTSFEVRDLEPIRADVSQGFKPRPVTTETAFWIFIVLSRLLSRTMPSTVHQNGQF